MTDAQWEALSNQAVAVAGVVYFLALISHLVEWSALRRVPAAERPTTGPIAMAGRLGLLLTMLAAAVHLVALVGRGMAADPNRVPWGTMYEFTISATFFVTLIYLLGYKRFSLSWMAPLVVGFVLSTVMTAVIWLYGPVAPLAEALYSPWLAIHVVSAIIASAAFTLGGLLSILYLLQSRRETRIADALAADRQSDLARVGADEVAGDPSAGAVLTDARPSAAEGSGRSGAGAPVAADTGYLVRVPSAEKLERLSYRIHAFAFPVWTFAVLITGPIWAHEAWSSYWNWDPKEVWSFITWVVYAAYLHARTTAGWKGRRSTWLALLGLATLWFNFIGINFFSTTSQHSYAEGAGEPTSLTTVVEGAAQAGGSGSSR